MKYILWLNYGSEEWVPHEYESEEEMIEAIKKGETHGNEFQITVEIELKLVKDIIK